MYLPTDHMVTQPTKLDTANGNCCGKSHSNAELPQQKIAVAKFSMRSPKCHRAYVESLTDAYTMFLTNSCILRF